MFHTHSIHHCTGFVLPEADQIHTHQSQLLRHQTLITYSNKPAYWKDYGPMKVSQFVHQTEFLVTFLMLPPHSF
ncbi:hypothetical protein HanIR_Chr05g0209001 [Helianthus annuus]|nr:hypothetical protein HanIR_Chr05g0209001 [Helianthus annuus]